MLFNDVQLPQSRDNGIQLLHMTDVVHKLSGTAGAWSYGRGGKMLTIQSLASGFFVFTSPKGARKMEISVAINLLRSKRCPWICRDEAAPSGGSYESIDLRACYQAVGFA